MQTEFDRNTQNLDVQVGQSYEEMMRSEYTESERTVISDNKQTPLSFIFSISVSAFWNFLNWDFSLLLVKTVYG